MMMAVSVLPILVFYKWVEQSSYEKEIAYVDENHLTIARNLSAALSRYVVDLKVVFALAVNQEFDSPSISSFKDALANFYICHIVVLDDDNQVVTRFLGKSKHDQSLPSPANLAHLRNLAAAANGEIAFSGIVSHQGKPHFFVVQQLPDGKFAMAPWDPGYVIKLQQSIAFGERGHSMVVDQNGLVVAHPNAEWQRISKNASKLSVVAAMMAGRTGVMQFYSPPMQAQMIAGYTSVPETGWGVMVPQPLSELADRAHDVQAAALLVAVIEILLAALISWWFASLLSRPIQKIVTTARAVTKGDFSTRVGRLPSHTPVEINLLATTFDHMVEDLQNKNQHLRQALDKAENISRERADLLAAATRANEIKSQFVSMVSHELRTPLTSIKGSLDLIESGILGPLSEQAARLIAIARKNSNRLATMIGDLLDLDKLDAGKMRYHFAKTDLAALINEAVEANKSYGDLNHITFKTFDTDQPVYVKGDQDRLMQVMANLLSNAAKFSRPGCQVEITLKAEETSARILVQDHGIGIPDGVHDKVFEKFVQLDSSDQRNAGGSGLGLSIARLIIEEHGGTLDYSSIEGEGTAFFCDLPLLATGDTA